MTRPRRARCTGFTYLGTLFAVALLGVGLAAAGQSWQAASQRDKEQELLFVGDQFRRAIGAYYESSPGGAKQFPASLDELLLDRRHPTVRRHLRRLYADPLTGGREWGLVRGPGERIAGVYSRAAGAPIKTGGFPRPYGEFAGAASYREWRFIYREGQDGVLGAGARDAASQAAAAPPPARTEKQRPPREVCETMLRTDAAACDLRQRRTGDGGACQASAQTRFDACVEGDPMPPLNEGGSFNR